ncbi:verprolin [Homalodisca vitripennis]|nr:verprolin [Homalodisca vitripennis]
MGSDMATPDVTQYSVIYSLVISNVDDLNCPYLRPRSAKGVKSNDATIIVGVMPFPPPPPPPPGPPPPPSFPTSAPQPVSAEGRNLLLQSIRQGTTLKKAVTNDKSAPAISGSVRPSSSSSSSGGSGGGSPRSNGGINGSATLGRSNGLAGLFAGGMPRLKPTGVDIGEIEYDQFINLFIDISCPCKQPTCWAIVGGLEVTLKPFSPGCVRKAY